MQGMLQLLPELSKGEVGGIEVGLSTDKLITLW